MRGIIEPVAPPHEGEPRPSAVSRLLWFCGLTLGGVGATALVAYSLRALLRL